MQHRIIPEQLKAAAPQSLFTGFGVDESAKLKACIAANRLRNDPRMFNAADDHNMGSQCRFIRAR